MQKTSQQSVCAIGGDTEFEQQIEGYFARNFLVNALDWAFFSLGMSFASVGTILPVYVSHLTSSKVLIGLVSTLANMGWFLPQIVTAPLLERLARRKPLVLVVGAVERLPFLLLASATFWLASASKGLLLVIFFGLLACHSFAGGLGGTAWQDLMAKIIPLRRRGRFFGISNLISGILGVGGALCARSILARYPYATNFALCFFIAFLAMSVSWCFLALTKEPPQRPSLLPLKGRHYWRQRLPDVLRSDSNFRRYLSARAVGALGGMAIGFLAVYAVGQFGLSDAQAALFTVFSLGSSMLSNLAWGMVGDRWGYKLVLEGASLLSGLALCLALLSNSVAGFYGVFALLGAAWAAWNIGGLSITFEFCGPSDRPTYIGLSNSLMAPFIGVAPLVGGLVAHRWGYQMLFLLSLCMTSFGLALLHWWVEEPRYRCLARYPIAVKSK